MSDCQKPLPGAPVIGFSDLLGVVELFTNTETSQPVTLPPIDEADESPKGLGWDGNKPLMRNRTANEVPSPIGNTGGNTFECVVEWQTRRRTNKGDWQSPLPAEPCRFESCRTHQIYGKMYKMRN